jgi:outer membrane autotransporter protein
MPESMTESLPESANLTESDFGSESGLNVESEVVPESVVAPEVEPPAAQPEGYPTGIILLNHCGNLIGDFGETVLTKPFNLYGVLHCGVERHRISFPLEVGFRSLLVGFNFCGDTAHGRWSGGAVLESGSATCHRRHGAGEDFRGESNCNCLGGGLLICGLLKFNDRNHVLLEVSGRTGRIENRWDNLTNSGDLRRKDDRTSSYGSTHCGVAYRLGGNKLLLDFFGKYFWTELAGKSFALKNESGTKLQNVHANRLRIGGKISLPSARRLCPYGSVAWERKFNTGGRESPHGAAIEQLSLEGSSYFGEIGLSCKFAAKQPLTVDVGIRGHVGTGHSVNGTIRALLEF